MGVGVAAPGVVLPPGEKLVRVIADQVDREGRRLDQALQRAVHGGLQSHQPGERCPRLFRWDKGSRLPA